MSAARGTVYIHEEDEWGRLDRGEWWCLGTYTVTHDLSTKIGDEAGGMTLDDALTWAAERTDRVWLTDAEGHRVWVGQGAAPGDSVDGRAAVAAGPPPVRRRHPAFAYVDRTSTDPPIAWTVSAWIGLPVPADRPEYQRPVMTELDGPVAALRTRPAGSGTVAAGMGSCGTSRPRSERRGGRRSDGRRTTAASTASG